MYTENECQWHIFIVGIWMYYCYDNQQNKWWKLPRARTRFTLNFEGTCFILQNIGYKLQHIIFNLAKLYIDFVILGVD